MEGWNVIAMDVGNVRDKLDGVAKELREDEAAISAALDKFDADPSSLTGNEKRLLGLAVCHGMAWAIIADAMVVNP